jgi:hypothetical protein
MKKLLILSLIFIAGLQVTKAQEFDSKRFLADVFQVDEFIKRNNLGISYADKDSYKGTPYNNPSYLNGNIYKGDELLATNVGLRFNAFEDEMEVKESVTSPDSEAKVLTKDPDIYVKIVNDIFVFVPYDGGIEGGGYFHVMFEGNKIDLFKKMKKEFVPEKKANSSITPGFPAQFKDDPIYYIVDKKGKFYELPSSKRKMLKVFGSNKDLVKDYIDQKDLDVDNEADLKRLIEYYDTL